MLESYRALIGIRRGSAALSRGEFTLVASASPAVLAFVRSTSTERVLVVTNFATSVTSTTLDLKTVAVPVGGVTEMLFGAALTPVNAANASQYPVAVSGRTTLWLRLP